VRAVIGPADPARHVPHTVVMYTLATPTEARTALRRYLLIIARDQVALYKYVRARFAGEESVDVILDRRRPGGERRRQAGDVEVERRSGDRRKRPDVDAALHLESMQFLTTCGD
jgi:hypothetical protein